MPRYTSSPVSIATRLTRLWLIVSSALLPISVQQSLAQTPATADVRDTTKPALRVVTATASWSNATWDEAGQKPVGTPLVIEFSAPAAPVALLGKAALPNTIKLSPEIPGVWSWVNSSRLTFEPQGGWLPPHDYTLSLGEGGFSPDCKVQLNSRPVNGRWGPELSCSFGEQSFYLDPKTPMLQQAVATVLFSHPVALEEVTSHLHVLNLSTTPLFAPASKPQVLADEKNPLRFFLRSPLIQLTDKEDLVRFEIIPGVTALTGGDPLKEIAITKITIPSRYTGFFFNKASTQIVNNEKDEPRQFIFLECKGKAAGKVIAKQTEAWELPPPETDKDGKEVAWTKENVTAAVLAKSTRVPMEYVPAEPTDPISDSFGFRLEPRDPGQLFIRLLKDTPAPGGFLTPEDFTTFVNVPEFDKEAQLIGRGGILALNGERKLNIKSRGYEHLRYTVARVPVNQINHFVSQTQGRFETPHFKGSFGFEDIARFNHSLQHIAKANDYQANYSSFDFAPALAAIEPAGAAAQRGLFYLVVQGVRRRTDEDGPASAGDPDPDWIALSAAPAEREDDESQNAKQSDARFVLITDLGMIVKRNAEGTRDVFIQSFQAREPVAEVHLTVVGRNGDPLAEVVTDGQGHAILPALEGMQRERQAVALIARKGSDLAFIPWERANRRVETSRFEIEGVRASEGSALNAFLFTERGIYRPGDPIQLAAIVRQRDWTGKLTGLPLEVILTDAKEEEAGRFPVKLSADGFITLTLPTTETSPTGVWRIELRRPDSKKEKADENENEEEEASLGQTLVRVEEFQPDRLKLTAKFDPDREQAWMLPENLSAQVDLQTLFGIAAADRRVTGKVHLTPAVPEFAQWPNWTFGLPNGQRFEPKEIDLGETQTDENGHAQFALALEAHTAPLLRVSVELEGFEADGGRGVHAELITLISRQPYLLGYKSEANLNFIERGTPTAFDIIAIGPDAKPLAATGLKRVLIETRHASVLTKQKNGTMAYVSQEVEKEIESVDGSIAATTTQIQLPVKTTGDFRYEWRNVVGTVQLTVAFNVVGAGDSTRSLERDTELNLTLADKSWKPGEELELSIRAPFAGAGLITIEREKVLASRWFKSEKASSLQHITVPEGLEGGAYVHVTFVRGLDSPEVFTNPLSTGVAPFLVTTDRRQIPITLDAPKQVRPGEKVTIGFSTPKATRIILWAVDEGIHRVTNYKAPAPLTRLLNKPALEVTTYQLLDLLLPEFTLLKNAIAIGGDGDAEEPPELKLGLNPFKRKRVAPVIFWSGIIECGPDRREVIYQVPDYFAGGLNIMAAAVAPDAVGVAKEHTIVKGPFVLTPNAPFFTAPGDEFTASVTVANQLEGAAVTDQIMVRAELEGGLEFVEKPAELVVIAPGKELTVRFRLRTTEALGNAEIKFTASANNERIEQRTTMSVRPATPRSTIVQSGWFRTDTHDVKIDHDFYPQFSKRETVVATTPLGLARGLATYLREFPFGCTEQITSRAFPWLVLRDEVSFGLDKAEATESINSAIAQLALRQSPNGGFGYWSNGNEDGFDYLSVYVAHFLTEAKASGFHVPAPMFDATLRRLRLMADAKVTPPYSSNGKMQYWLTRQEANVQAAAIYLLTRNEEVTTNYALTLSDFLKAKLPIELWHRDASAVWLASTWRLLKKDDEAKRLIELHRRARAVRQPSERWTNYYESQLTDEATTFTALCRHFPEIAGKFGYDELKPITEMIENGLFHTLSASWSVQALKSYSALVKANGVKAGIAQGGAQPKTVAEAQAGMVSTNLKSGTARFFLLRNGDAKLGAWYQTIETGFDHTLPTKPETRTLEVFREILDEAEQPVDVAKVGDSLLIKITVRNLGKTEQPNLALSELLPGAFDFAPQSEVLALKPGLGTLEGTDYVDVREDRALLFCGLEKNETRTFTYEVRPTCAGTFAVPPAYAESMYDRAVHGHGVATKFTVLPRE